MCVVFFAYWKDPEFPLVLLANRDEYYDRPAEAARDWVDFPQIFAGRDLVGGGTWLGVNESGKFAAVTNYRDPSAPKGSWSRGNLAADFLKRNESAARYLEEIVKQAGEFQGSIYWSARSMPVETRCFIIRTGWQELRNYSRGSTG
jgi:uncharacterized protein with NRDE domain